MKVWVGQVMTVMIVSLVVRLMLGVPPVVWREAAGGGDLSSPPTVSCSHTVEPQSHTPRQQTKITF